MALAYYVVSPGHLQQIIVFKQTLQEAGAVAELFSALGCAVWGPKLSRTIEYCSSVTTLVLWLPSQKDLHGTGM